MRRENELIRKIISRKKHSSKEQTEMVELCKKFIDKECIIYTYNSQIIATLKEVTDGALLIEEKGDVQAVNVDFVVRIREYPKKKNGKKKTVVID
jgi:ABC-type antimicrobial peptide transport system ATPase subunit